MRPGELGYLFFGKNRRDSFASTTKTNRFSDPKIERFRTQITAASPNNGKGGWNPANRRPDIGAHESAGG
jgi:hypothetical protein